MQMKDYFAYFGLPVRFHPDERELKRRFLQKSRETHPDFYTLATPEAQEQALAESALNNEAYKILSDKHSRIRYLLEYFDVLRDEEKEQVSPAFLMEMMELNEQLSEAAFDPELRATVKEQIETKHQQVEAEMDRLTTAFDQSQDRSLLEKIKALYFQLKYLKRLFARLADARGL